MRVPDEKSPTVFPRRAADLLTHDPENSATIQDRVLGQRFADDALRRHDHEFALPPFDRKHTAAAGKH